MPVRLTAVPGLQTLQDLPRALPQQCWTEGESRRSPASLQHQSRAPQAPQIIVSVTGVKRPHKSSRRPHPSSLPPSSQLQTLPRHLMRQTSAPSRLPACHRPSPPLYTGAGNARWPRIDLFTDEHPTLASPLPRWTCLIHCARAGQVHAAGAGQEEGRSAGRPRAGPTRWRNRRLRRGRATAAAGPGAAEPAWRRRRRRCCGACCRSWSCPRSAQEWCALTATLGA